MIKQIARGWLVAFTLFTAYSAAYATSPKLPKADQVVVYKSERQMLLIRDGKILKKYRIALGGQPQGHKVREGDHRTPEGIYYIQARNHKSRYYLSLKISYPSATDKARAQKMGVPPGGNIMIHGMSDEYRNFWGRVKDWTQGCIAVRNHEIEEIWEMVGVGTPIKIFP
jgi:murein L,D-transpeptidase YafK